LPENVLGRGWMPAHAAGVMLEALESGGRWLA
jgi:hypothetical protein